MSDTEKSHFEKFYGMKIRRDSEGNMVLDGEQTFVATLDMGGMDTICEEETFPDGEDPQFVIAAMVHIEEALVADYVTSRWGIKL